MPATKIRKEQLKLTLNDLLALDRTFTSGNHRNVNLLENEVLNISGNVIISGNLDMSGFGSINVFNLISSSATIDDLLINNSLKLANGTSAGTILMITSSQGDVGGNSGQLFWDLTNNRLGVGTATPSEKLDIFGNLRVRNDIILNLDGENGQVRKIDIYGYNSYLKIGEYGILGRFQKDNDVTLGTSYFTYLSNGAQHVDGANENTFIVFNPYIDGSVLTISQQGFRFLFGDATENNQQLTLTELVRITNAGFVGIGTTSPSEKLHIAGNIRVDGNVYLQPSSSPAVIGTQNNANLRIIVNNTERVLIPSNTSGNLTFYQRVRFVEGIQLDATDKPKVSMLYVEYPNEWSQYTSSNQGVNGWGCYDFTYGTGYLFYFSDQWQAIVFFNGQALKLGSISNGNIVNGDYVWINGPSSSPNSKVLVLSEQPLTGDVVMVVGFIYTTYS